MGMARELGALSNPDRQIVTGEQADLHVKKLHCVLYYIYRMIDAAIVLYDRSSYLV